MCCIERRGEKGNMIDLKRFEQYREGNQLEVKRAAGGLPQSIWETYSSFANTSGGVILLGVAEQKDGSFQISGILEPERLVKEFWDTINNSQKVSRNILSSRHVAIHEVEEKRIIAITVPKADRRDRPVYVGNNPFSGSYRRDGEGDYRCSQEEVRMMLRDQAESSQDTHLIEQMGLDVFDYDSVSRYRNRMKNNRPGHVWEDFDDPQFLYRLGAVGRSEAGSLHPTAAGLLMFGYDYEIVKEFPNYFLDYREQLDETKRWTDRLCSGTGNWSGNIFDFYFKTYQKLYQDIKVPFSIENGLERVDDTPVHIAVREALANCVINADYYGRQGLVVIKKPGEMSFSNPGNFRIDIKDAISGGISDPRNGTLIKMFNLINIGERSGSGIPMIFSVWEKQGWQEPELEESFNPDRSTLRLWLPFSWESTKSVDKKASIKSVDKKASIKSVDKKASIKSVDKKTMRRRLVLKYLDTHSVISSAEVSALLGLEGTQARKVLREMVLEGILIAEGNNRNRRYRRAE